MNESEYDLTLLSEPCAQIVFSNGFTYHLPARGGHTEQIALWTEGEIGVDDANKSYNPCTYNGPPSSHKEQRNELGIASVLTLLNGVCLESALRAF